MLRPHCRFKPQHRPGRRPQGDCVPPLNRLHVATWNGIMQRRTTVGCTGSTTPAGRADLPTSSYVTASLFAVMPQSERMVRFFLTSACSFGTTVAGRRLPSRLTICSAQRSRTSHRARGKHACGSQSKSRTVHVHSTGSRRKIDHSKSR